jgi:hypothetical protein
VPNQPTTLSAMGTTGGCFSRVGESSIVKRPETAASIETGSIRPRSLLSVENDGCVNQPGLLAKRLDIEAVLLQKSRALICIRPALAEAGIALKNYDQLDADERAWLEAYFRNSVQLILTPLAVDVGHPFPMGGRSLVR